MSQDDESRSGRTINLYFRDRVSLFERMRRTHRDDQVMFGLQLVAQREDEALRVLLALTDEEHPTTHTDKD